MVALAPGRRRRISDETAAGWISISPWIIGFLLFTAWPVAASLYFSFTKYNVVESPHWIGLDNYRELLGDDDRFFKSVRNTVVYSALYVPLHVATAMGVALLLNQARKMTGVFRDRKSTRLNSSHTVIYTLSLHDALPISEHGRLFGALSAPARRDRDGCRAAPQPGPQDDRGVPRSEEHTSELQSHSDLHSFPTRRSSDLGTRSSIRRSICPCTSRPRWVSRCSSTRPAR